MSRPKLTHTNRIELATLLRQGYSRRAIAKSLGVHHSTICRELQRNKYANLYGYHAGVAQRHTRLRRTRANQAFRKLPNNVDLVDAIVVKLQAIWSPQQIAGWLKQAGRRVRVCAQTIYDWIYTFRPDLKRHLHCRKGQYRRTRAARLRYKRRAQALEARRISKRPASIEKRHRFGHWEGDTVVGAAQSGYIATFVERRSGYLLAAKLKGHLAEDFTEAAEWCFRQVPSRYRKTLTLDNGREMADYERLEQLTDLSVYFAYPYHSWERGTNENTNGLLRFFFPKKTSFASVVQTDIDRAVYLLNTRPRKRLGYRTPEQVFKSRWCDLD